VPESALAVSDAPAVEQPHGGPEGSALVRIEGLSVHYLGRESWVLDSVSLTHLRGRVTAVIGPSGCGKTTLVRALCGLIPHCLPSEYSGSLSLDGTEVADATVQTLAETVAYVGQSPDAAVVTRTVHDDVAFPLQNLCLPRSEITSRVHEALRGVGLIERIWDDPWTLSGGQRQRLAVAVALAMHPRLLVLDEPTSTIDTTGREEFYDLISSLTASGTAVVVIDHDLDPVLPIVDQVLALDTVGGIIAVGWDPGLFSLNRLFGESVLENGSSYTFWGKGVSQGHSDAIRRIEGVVDARQYTVPIESALERVRAGENPKLSTREKHLRECYVVVQDGVDKARIEREIKTMPNYFADYDTSVHFVSLETLKKEHGGIPHGGFVLRSGTTGEHGENKHLIEFSLKLDSNPEFTASVLVAYARAAYRLAKKGESGAFSVFDIAPALLSPKSADELRREIL